MVFFIGFCLTFISFLVTFIFYHEIDVEESYMLVRSDEVNSDNIFRLWYDVLTDRNFWKYLFFAIITIGMKMIFNMLSLIIPKILTSEFGEHALYGVIIAVCPLFIVIFLFATSPCTIHLDPYS